MRFLGAEIGKRAAFALFVFILTSAPLNAGQKPDTVQLEPHDIKLMARPVPFKRGDSAQKIFGKLIWRGGFHITSQSPYLGGYSGAAISSNGTKLILVSDAGTWAMMPLQYHTNRSRVRDKI